MRPLPAPGRAPPAAFTTGTIAKNYRLIFQGFSQKVPICDGNHIEPW
jgi:hypothetical protein